MLIFRLYLDHSPRGWTCGCAQGAQMIGSDDVDWRQEDLMPNPVKREPCRPVPGEVL